METEGEATPAPVDAAAPKVKMHLVSDDIYTRVVSEGFKDFNYVDDEWLRKDADTDYDHMIINSTTFPRLRSRQRSLTRSWPP